MSAGAPPLLLPTPRRIRQLDGVFRAPVQMRLVWTGDRQPRVPPRAACLRDLEFELVPRGIPGHKDGALVLDRHCGLADQHYRLRIDERGVHAEAAGGPGAFHALQTLRQIARTSGEEWPAMEIEDGPDFSERGVMLDISRDKVPSLDTLLGIVDLLADLKFNRLELYTEHTFAYRAHSEVWAGASPLTPDDVRVLDEACRARCIELVPNQNSFAHMERWLRHPRYAGLAECPEGGVPPWDTERRPPSTLDPGNPGSLDLLRGLYEELLPCFTSRKFNVGGDEPWGLGQGHSRAACTARGRGRVYLDFLLKLRGLVQAHGREMCFWGDFCHEHPELLPHLPRDLVPMEWGYEAEHDFSARLSRFASVGLRFLVCPGTSSWNSVAGRTDNALANLRNAGAAGRATGAAGYVVTDWGDNGHWQYWPVSFLPLAAAAAHAWNGAAAEDSLLIAACGRHVFRDADGGAAEAARDMGNVYRLAGQELPNATVLFRLLAPQPASALVEGLSPAALLRAGEAATEAAARIARTRMERPDAELVRKEFANAARILQLAAQRGTGLRTASSVGNLAASCAAIMEEHRRLWRARNREGGLAASVERMEKLRLALTNPPRP